MSYVRARSVQQALGGVYDSRLKDGQTLRVHVLGVGLPVKVKQTNVLGAQFTQLDLISGGGTVTVMKNRVPAELATVINKKLGESVQAELKGNPGLARTPKKLLDQAKSKIGLGKGMSQSYLRMKAAGFDLPETLGHLGVANIPSIGGMDVAGSHWAMTVFDSGSGYTVHFVKFGDPGVLDQVLDVVSFPLKLIAQGVDKVIDLIKTGVEALLNILEELMKQACAAAQDDLATLVGAAGATAAGAPPEAGALGVSVVRAMCPHAAPPVISDDGSKFPLVPVAIAAAGALLLYLGMRE